MSLKRFIPNGITLLNLLSGCIAVILAVNELFVAAAFFVFLGIFLDFFDGFFARKLKVQSDLGVQLDSLADLVTSGLVPGIVMLQLLTQASNSKGIELAQFTSFIEWESFKIPPIALLGLCITLASAYRLAKFNLDEEQQSYFKGLPTPANALFILSLPLILEFQNNDAINAIILNQWFLLALTVVSCYLLNAKVKLFALKFKNWSFKDNIIRYVFIFFSLVLLIVLQFLAVPIIIVFYIVVSLFNKID